MLEALLRDDFLEHILSVFDAVVLETELPNVYADIFVADELLLQNVLQENQDDAHHPLLVDLVLVALAAALVHAVFDEQVSELFRELDMVAQPIENFKQTCRELHLG